MKGLAERLEALVAEPRDPWLEQDPLRFPQRYQEPADIEIAGVVAALLAYGRVDLFMPVVARLLGGMEEAGGPSSYILAFDEKKVEALRPILYRWNRHPDFAFLFRTLQAVYQHYPSLGAIFEKGPAKSSLTGAIATLRRLAPPEPWSHGFRSFFSSPEDGSACKRWLMLMRWMVRRESPDLGLWSHLDPADLVMPLDTHVSRISRFIGLTRRTDASWRTAEEVTTALRRLCPTDPVRYDFALAHLGISEGCLGHRDAKVCGACPLDAVCTASPA